MDICSDRCLLLSMKTAANMPITAKLSCLVMKMWLLSNEDSEEGFQQRALNTLSECLGFNAAVWGYALSTPDAFTPHSVVLHNLPRSILADCRGIEDQYRIDEHKAQRLGVARLRDGDRLEMPLSDSARAFFEKYDLHHGCSLCIEHEFSGLNVFISLYRRKGQSAFQAHEADLLESAFIHMVTAFDQYRRRILVLNVGCSETGGGAALVDEQGTLHVADQKFMTTVHENWPGWRGPKLPPELQLHSRQALRINNTVFSWSILPGEDLYQLISRPEAAVDLLTSRQFEIALSYARGKAHKEIARKFGITPSTVRNHVRMIYLALKVRNKSELLQALDASPVPTQF